MNDSVTSIDGSTAAAQKAGLRFYWQPGCSSCVKVKEMLTDLGVDFTSVNILEHDDALEELLARGVRSVPVLIRGEEMMFAQSLEDVAKFVGRNRVTDRLPPAELMNRWQYFLGVGVGLIRQIPSQKLDLHPVPGRERTVCSLAYHIYQVPEGFLSIVTGGAEDSRLIDNAVYDHLRSVDDLLGYADGIVQRVQQWWQDGSDKAGDRPIQTYYGLQPLHQVLDRATWHSAQHTRQLNTVLDGLGVVVARPIDPSAYVGLPMPKAIWE